MLRYYKMAIVNQQGYLERTTAGKCYGQKGRKGTSTKRNWWLIKSSRLGCGYVTLNTVSLPKHLVGRRVRFKMEVIEE